MAARKLDWRRPHATRAPPDQSRLRAAKPPYKLLCNNVAASFGHERDVFGPAVTAEAKAHPEAMVTLLDLWASRVAAFDAGLLKLMRFSAIKVSNLRLMSEW